MLTAIIITVFLVGIILSCIYIIYEHNSPAATLAWLLLMIMMPFFGLAAYLVLGRRRVDMRIKLLRAIRDGVGDIREKLEFQNSFHSVVKTGGCSKKYEDLMRLAYRFPGLFHPRTGRAPSAMQPFKSISAAFFPSSSL